MKSGDDDRETSIRLTHTSVVSAESQQHNTRHEHVYNVYNGAICRLTAHSKGVGVRK